MCIALLAACLLLLAPVLNAQLDKPKYHVANGQLVQKYQIRYQVRLDIADGKDKYVCGGSIIDNQHVLTAAHCVTVSDSKQTVFTSGILVQCGMTDVNDPETKKNKVEKIILHDGYDPSDLRNDIAILKVQKAFQFGNAVAAIVRTPAKPIMKKNCVVSGWGHTEKNRQVQNELRSTVVHILDGSDCAKYFGKFFHESKLCAGNNKGNDACLGDSGGPLTCDNQLVGVVSSGKKKCGGDGSRGLGLYADVSYYNAWIDEKIKPRSSLNPLRYIKHGFRKATIQEFPYQVLLFMDSGGICGGTILSKKFVLTAAHCVTLRNSSAPMPARNLRVMAKLINMSEPGSQEYRVQKLIIHPKYNSVNFSNDLALLKVEQSFVFSTRVGSVPRRNGPLSPAEDGCVVSGWGNINQTNIQQQVLQYVTVDIFTRNNCSQLYGTQLENDKFCARGTENTNTCMGDPGGPLTCGNELVGVVSAGIFCGNKSNSGIRVYTDVYKHKDWIDKYVEKNASGSASQQMIYPLLVIIYSVIITELI
ncbi:transmembrane protease serine 9 isoform X2 [Anabrus simplex]|uniref:transmembrane protease serine 9 isoform X2 n=1 Tax=Anabrus simplex TaxID=316456 RepID=UPI0035A2E126